MKKTLRTLTVFLLLALPLGLYSQTAIQPAGSGDSENDPYLITQLEELYWIADQVNSQSNYFEGKYFRQENNIDAISTQTWFEGKGWDPIGLSAPKSFKGFYDGAGHTITNLFINRPDEYYAGLWGYLVIPGKIENLGIVDVNITGSGYTAALAGRCLGSIDNCYTTGIVNGTQNYVGGLTGGIRYGHLSNSYSTCEVHAPNSDWVGGLVGEAVRVTETDYTVVFNCFATGNVSGKERVGGLIGHVNNTELLNSYSTGTVRGEASVGGLAGRIAGTSSRIANSYTRSEVIQSNGTALDIGAFAGNFSMGVIEHCYSTGSVFEADETTPLAGNLGFVGMDSESTYNGNFYNNETSNQTSATGATGLSAVQMQSADSFVAAGWNFKGHSLEEIWNMGNSRNDGYPYLNWQHPEDKAGQTITFDPLPEKTYGDAAFELTATASSGLEVSYTSSNPDVATVSGKTVTIVGAGTTDITASQGGDAVFDPAPQVTQTLTVNPKALTATADFIAKEYDGQVLETFTVSFDGFVNSEGVEDLSGELTFTGSAIGAKDVGDYAIVPGGLTSANYNISFVEGLLRISPKWLLITASPKAKLYGSPDPAFTAFYNGFVGGENVSVLEGELSIFREPGEDAGEYTLTPSGYTSDNYDINFSNGILFINPAPLEITTENKEKMYGQEDPAFTVSYSGFAFDENESVLEGTLVISREPGEDTGVYEITASGLTANNYALSYTAGQLEITPAPLTISANAQSKNYGDPDPELTYLLVDSELVGEDTLSGELSRAAGEDVGTYPILLGTLDAGPNYQIYFEDAQLVITPRNLVIAVTNTAKTYGTADPAFEVTYDTFAFDEDVSNLTGTLTFTREPGENVGTYAVTASGLTSDNYNITFVDGELEITPAELTVTAQNATKVYGENDPDFSVVYSGFQWTDDESNLTGTLTFTREPGEDVGTYAVTGSGLTSGNYTITFVDGELEITPAELTVTAQNATKVYGETDPAFSVIYSGLQWTDDESNLTGTLTFSREPGEDVGTYAVTASGLTSDNYNITFVVGELEITPASLTVTVQNATKVYGENDPDFSVVYSGFQWTDDESNLTGTLTFNREPGEDVGTYLVTASGLTSGNYTITFVDGELVITQAELTVTVQNATKVYGENDPDFSVVYSGFQWTDDESNLTGTLTFTREPGEDVGTYLVTASGLTSGNYTITFVEGELEITPASLTVTVQNATKVYGETDPDFSVVYGGFQWTDDESNLTGTLTFTREPGENVGTYAVTASGLTSDNYNITFVDGELEITPAELTVTTQNATKVYGETDPDFSVVYSGFQWTDDESNLTGTLTFSREPGEDVGTYAVTASGLTSDNYTITFVDGELEITPASLTITVQNATKVYGENDPDFSVVYSGFQYTDDESNLTGTLTFTREPGEDVGTYVITASGLTSDNYNITFVDGELEITIRTLFIGGSFMVEDKEYDGTTFAVMLENNLTLETLAFGDEIVLTDIELAFDHAGPGEAIVVNIVSASISGPETVANYALSLEGAPTATATIYEPLFILTLEAAPSAGGTVTGAGSYEEGEVVEISAVAEEGYEFVNWINLPGNVISQEATFSFVMPNENVTLRANFDIIDHVEEWTENTINLYPNPARSSVNIESVNTLRKVRISDLTGKVVFEQVNTDGNAMQIAVNHFRPGIYLVHIETLTGTEVRKLQVVR